jgi:hypothetical protein
MLTTKTMKIGLFALTGVLAVGLFTGCQTDTKTGTLASVVITNQPMSAITQAVDAVFVSHGYSGGRIGPGQFAYHRTGTRSDNVAYNNYTFDEIVTIRVVVVINKIDAGSTLVGCDAWLVEGADDPVFGDNPQIRKLRKWPYQQLLRDIQTQLGQ